jgi:hypothetical protein
MTLSASLPAPALWLSLGWKMNNAGCALTESAHFGAAADFFVLIFITILILFLGSRLFSRIES